MYKQLHPFCIFDEEQEEYLCGFIDSNSIVVIPPKYEVAEDFSEGLAHVAEYGWGSAYGFINPPVAADVLSCGRFEIWRKIL